MRGKRLVVPGFGNKVVAFLPRIVPRNVLLALVAQAAARAGWPAPQRRHSGAARRRLAIGR